MPITRRKSWIVTICTLAIGATSIIVLIGLERRGRYESLAQYHLGEMASFDALRRSDADLADQYEGRTPRGPILAYLNPADPAQIRASENRNEKRAAYHAALSRKYQDAAARPWIAVESDPTSP